MRRHLSASGTLRAVALAVLVLVVVLIGLPVLVGGSPMDGCPECAAPVTASCVVPCVAIPATSAVIAVALFGFVFVGPCRPRGLLFAWSIDPPPRLA